MLDHIKRLFAKEKNEKWDGEVHYEGCVIEWFFFVGGEILFTHEIYVCLHKRLENTVTCALFI